MRARAPGKLVLSGAYSVLEGAPALVTAVDRYALADTERKPEWVSDEARLALGTEAVPHCDVTALREGGRKLGLGSSAAIVVASLAAAWGKPDEPTSQLRARLLEPALRAHRQAQGGGSGVDVAAAVHGGALRAQRRAEGLELIHVRLPESIRVETFASGVAASTRDMLAAVRGLAEARPALHRQLLERLARGAEASAEAACQGHASTLLAGLQAQQAGLEALGAAAEIPIVTPSGAELAAAAERAGGVFLPAGAGGGDVSVWVGPAPSPEGLRQRARALGWSAVELHVEAAGAALLPPSGTEDSAI